MQRFDNSPMAYKAIELLRQTSKTLCTINYVAKKLNVAWVTARALLLTLVIEGKVRSQKTTHGLIFWVDGAQHQRSA